MLSVLLRAGIAARTGKREDAATLLRENDADAEAVGLYYVAAVARRRRGELVGGALGAELIASADRRMAELGIANPKRMTEAVAPGFTPGERKAG